MWKWYHRSNLYALKNGSNGSFTDKISHAFPFILPQMLDHFILDIIIYTYYYIYTVITSLSILYEFGTRECSLVEF